MNGEPDENPDKTRVRLAPAPDVAAPITPTPQESAAHIGYGTVLSGRYRLEEQLGSGGMAVVYAATDLQMPGVRVAIKMLQAELREQPVLLNLLRESVRKVRALPHPNIAGVYSVDADGPNDFVIMELLQGQTLKALL